MHHSKNIAFNTEIIETHYQIKVNEVLSKSPGIPSVKGRPFAEKPWVKLFRTYLILRTIT